MKIIKDDLSGELIKRFLDEHIEEMLSVSPPESKHALDIDALRSPEITFWSVYDGGAVVVCGALKQLDSRHGEIKSMRVCKSRRGQGAGVLMLEHILDEARRRSYSRVSLETGSMAYFDPARRLYQKFGFQQCAPFSGYKEDPNSIFLSLDLAEPR